RTLKLLAEQQRQRDGIANSVLGTAAAAHGFDRAQIIVECHSQRLPGLPEDDGVPLSRAKLPQLRASDRDLPIVRKLAPGGASKIAGGRIIERCPLRRCKRRIFGNSRWLPL